MEFINLTSSTIQINGQIIAPAENPAWVDLEQVEGDPINGLPTTYYTVRDYENIPAEQDGVTYLVPSVAVEWMAREYGRYDLAAPVGERCSIGKLKFLRVDSLRTASFATFENAGQNVE